jgi:hypothetical protein
MKLSRRDLVKSHLVLAGASAIGLGAVAEARAQSGAPGGREAIELWPYPPAGALHPGMAEVVEQSSSDPAYSSRRAKGISRPHCRSRCHWDASGRTAEQGPKFNYRRDDIFHT